MKYKIEYDYTDLGGDGNYHIFKRQSILFGLITCWEIEKVLQTEEQVAEWIDENVKSIDDNIYLKKYLYNF